MADRTRLSRSRRALRWLAFLAGLSIIGLSTTRRSGEGDDGGASHAAPSGTASRHAGHETTDISVGSTAAILAAMAATTALAIGIVFAMVWRFHVAQQQSWATITPLQKVHVLPPGPRLQIQPFADLAREQARQNHLLHNYAWVSADHSIARIPISRAMTLTVGRTLGPVP